MEKYDYIHDSIILNTLSFYKCELQKLILKEIIINEKDIEEGYKKMDIIIYKYYYNLARKNV